MGMPLSDLPIRLLAVARVHRDAKERCGEGDGFAGREHKVEARRWLLKFAAVLLALSVVVPTAFASSTSRDPAYRPQGKDVALARKTILGRAFIGPNPHPNAHWIVGVPTCRGFAPDRSALTVTGKAAAFYSDGSFGMGSEVDVYDSPIEAQAAWRLLTKPAYAFCAAEKLVAWWHTVAKFNSKLIGVYHFLPHGGPRQEIGYQIAIRVSNAKGAATVSHSVVWMSLDDSIARIEAAAPSACTCADEGVAALYRNYYG